VREFRNQLRQVFRRLARAPMFTAITLITLAAGVGANTVVFSVLEGVLLKPLPYPRAEDLVGVWQTAPGLNIKDLNVAPSTYFIFREQNQSFVDVGAYQYDGVGVGQGGVYVTKLNSGATALTYSAYLGNGQALEKVHSPMSAVTLST